jgi:ribosomal 50S subunit-associated protein YjgA (DUF615 family)
MAQVSLSSTEARQLDKALRLLRDRHYSNYHNAKDQTSETAQKQYATYQQLDELRFRIVKESM